MTWKFENRIFIKLTTFGNVNCDKFPGICLSECRHVSQLRADILNIIYDGEYSMNYYILLIINVSSKQCVLLVPNSCRLFSQQVTDSFCRKLLP
jgi:hypothetical protein